MPRKINVTFQEDEIKINGRSTSPKSGSNGRSVYITDDGKFIIKVDDRGYTHDDVGTYAGIARQDRKYFVPILAQGYTDDGFSWSVQPYLNLSWDKTDEDEEIIEYLEIKYDLFDIHEDNWAIYKGHPILFDYGME